MLLLYRMGNGRVVILLLVLDPGLKQDNRNPTGKAILLIDQYTYGLKVSTSLEKIELTTTCCYSTVHMFLHSYLGSVLCAPPRIYPFHILPSFGRHCF